ncbi:hypothetical protein OK016_26920 [Vibrio chagasii]|nr:hypothetical protein [Vibrio chagasii]
MQIVSSELLWLASPCWRCSLLRLLLKIEGKYRAPDLSIQCAELCIGDSFCVLSLQKNTIFGTFRHYQFGLRRLVFILSTGFRHLMLAELLLVIRPSWSMLCIIVLGGFVSGLGLHRIHIRHRAMLVLKAAVWL